MSYLLSLLSGILTGLSMPGNLFSFLVFFSLIFYLKNMADSKKTYERFLHTIIYSFSMLFTTFWWQIPVLTKNIPQVLNGYSSFIGFIGFIGMILLLVLPYLLIWLLSEMYHNRKYRKENYWSLVLFYSFAYTAAEGLKTIGDFAFTGGSLGYALYDHIGILQIASIFGYLGISFIIVFINSLIAFDKSRNWIIKIPIILSMIYVVNFSIERFLPMFNDEDSFKVTAIQMNVPQNIKYNSNKWNSYMMFSDILKETQEFDTDLVILPESAFLEDIRDTEINLALKVNISSVNKPVIMGYPRMSLDKNYNTAWLYDSEGNISDYYDKVKLVPFAEFLPYKFIFDNFNAFNLIRYYETGKEYNVFDVSNTKIGTQICFETYFPEVSNELTKNGAQFLLSITNDGWFDNNTALKQHFSQIIFRAVENRKEFLQVSNTGLTGKVDKYGRITDLYKPHEEKMDNFEVFKNDDITIYIKIRNILKIILFILALLFAII
ncbi:apolipoprotein N-acyltransferase [Oceanotoga teriensis]|uniref:Apolipoprotein N-acyltransferase n=1 Tax=Oceanotoga teriensis TaxID=515440 RepID=A0AA45HHU3_9BACT|nr:apolipoprotein N-acyltransferase [Oceanotoga teriensis]PWJ87557.1 apolipoprotein N-acyltransferase [Oceanotoga teriensis]